MEKILNLRGLGTGGRQNEMIEMALTHKFDGIEVDMADLLGRFETMGRQFALQFLKSAKTGVGTFRLPMDFGAEDAVFAKALSKLGIVCELAKELQCQRCYVEIEAGSDRLAFHENFELHRKRMQEVALRLAEANIRLGVALQPLANQNTQHHKFIHTPEELLTLVKMVGHPHVGVLVDTWNWQACGYTEANLPSLDLKLVTECRLADISDEAKSPTLTAEQIVLPGDSYQSLALELVKRLCRESFTGAVSIQTHASQFFHQNRDVVVADVARRLSLLLSVGLGTSPESSLRRMPDSDALVTT